MALIFFSFSMSDSLIEYAKELYHRGHVRRVLSLQAQSVTPLCFGVKFKIIKIILLKLWLHFADLELEVIGFLPIQQYHMIS